MRIWSLSFVRAHVDRVPLILCLVFWYLLLAQLMRVAPITLYRHVGQNAGKKDDKERESDFFLTKYILKYTLRTFGCRIVLNQYHPWSRIGNEYIPTRPNDYAIRQGLTQKPLTTQDIAKNFPVLHARLRSLCFFEQLAYRLNSNVPIMGRGKGSHNIRKKRLPRPRKSLSKKQKQTANSS